MKADEMCGFCSNCGKPYDEHFEDVDGAFCSKNADNLETWCCAARLTQESAGVLCQIRNAADSGYKLFETMTDEEIAEDLKRYSWEYESADIGSLIELVKGAREIGLLPDYET